MKHNSNATLPIPARQYKGQFNTNARELQVEDIWPLLDTYEDKSPPITGDGSRLVYLLYTSGSTGKPKGVQIEHHSLVNLLLSMQKTPGMPASDTPLAVTTTPFLISGLELDYP